MSCLKPKRGTRLVTPNGKSTSLPTRNENQTRNASHDKYGNARILGTVYGTFDNISKL